MGWHTHVGWYLNMGVANIQYSINYSYDTWNNVHVVGNKKKKKKVGKMASITAFSNSGEDVITRELESCNIDKRPKTKEEIVAYYEIERCVEFSKKYQTVRNGSCIIERTPRYQEYAGGLAYPSSGYVKD